MKEFFKFSLITKIFQGKNALFKNLIILKL